MPRAAREQLILEVAGQVFAQAGFHPASMDDIARLAGVSKPMIYSYFGSKERLYVAYIDGMGRALLARLTHAGRREDQPVVRLRARIVEFLAFVDEHRDGWIVLFTEVSSSGPLAEEVAEVREQIAQAIKRMLHREVNSGRRLPPPAADALAHAIVGAGESLANWWLERPQTSREEVADWYVGLVRAAVAAGVRRDVQAR